MKPANVKLSTYINSSKEINDEKTKFKIGDIVRISKEVCVIKKVKIQCHGHMFLVILIEKILLERFTKENFKKQIKKSPDLKN